MYVSCLLQQSGGLVPQGESFGWCSGGEVLATGYISTWVVCSSPFVSILSARGLVGVLFQNYWMAFSLAIGWP